MSEDRAKYDRDTSQKSEGSGRGTPRSAFDSERDWLRPHKGSSGTVPWDFVNTAVKVASTPQGFVWNTAGKMADAALAVKNGGAGDDGA